MSRRGSWFLSLFAATAVLAAIATLWLEKTAPGSFLPHGYCFTWNPALLWTHVVSDSLIGAAYLSIPITLLHLRRQRTDLPFNWIVALFAVFILSCGATHWIEVWTVWHPDYWLSGNVKLITAVASVLTAAALIRLVPRILAIPTVEQLQVAKNALEVEVLSRRRAEEALLIERADLERRVEERTEELARAKSKAESAHAAAEEANRVKDRFLAKVSHELRTPLQATMGWAQVLQNPALGADRIAHAADRIANNVRAQARLLDDLLDVSRILSGKLSLEFQRVDVVDILRKAVDVVRAGQASEVREIDVTLADGPIFLWTDPVRVEQVLWNLLNNAAHATAQGGRIAVGVDVEGKQLKVDIQDQGEGIDPSDLATIFEPFWQSTRNARSSRGLGLGLAISKSIAQLMGGDLGAASAGLGLGATFTLRLPMTNEPGDEGPDAERTLNDEERRRVKGVRILYVEDDLDIAASVEQALGELGLQVETCSDFAQALRRVGEGGFDLLLADLNLGNGHTAVELLAELRRFPHGKELVALVLSAYGADEHRKTTLAAGFTAHLVKPLSAERLVRAIISTLPI